MARPREFERSEALQHAVEAFWDLGYEATSTAVLEERMAIGRSSLYAAFGSKDDLYAEALARYVDELRGRVISRLRAKGPALSVLRSFFNDVARRGAPGGERLRCCMVVRASISRVGQAQPIASLIDQAVAELDAAFLALLQRGREDGTIRARGSLRGLARYLTTTFQGLNIAANAGRSRRDLHDIIRCALAALG
jgi:TetR/AcrR family transcriptional repressor of nem operon